MKRHTVVGIYDDAAKARSAEKELINDGFSREKVDLSVNEKRDQNKSSSFFGNLFGNNDEARRHTEVAQKGTVITVHTQSLQEAERAAAILDKFGTLDVGNTRRTQTDTDRATGKTTDTTTNKQSIPVIEENMEVGKREVTTGGARLRSRIVERPVEEHLRLREEHINIDRQPVDRRATDADFDNFKEGTIEAKERAEVPVVNKEARVVEEVNINKNVTERKETVRDSVRKTDVDVEKIRAEEERKKERR